MATTRLIQFTLGGLHFAIDVAVVRGLRRENDDCVGMRHFDLAKHFHLPASDAPNRILVDVGSETVAIAAANVAQMTDLTADDIHPLSPLFGKASCAAFAGVVRFGSKELLLLRPAALGLDGVPVDTSPICAIPFPPDLVAREGVTDRLVIFPATEEEGERPVSFGLGMRQVAEVVALPEIVRVPLVPNFVRGVAAWRSGVVPVIDLGIRMGLAPAASRPHDRLLVVRGPADVGPVGVIVRESTRMVSLPMPNEPANRAAIRNWAFVKGAVELKRETLLLVDLAAALSV